MNETTLGFIIGITSISIFALGYMSGFTTGVKKGWKGAEQKLKN